LRVQQLQFFAALQGTSNDVEYLGNPLKAQAINHT